MLRHMWVRNLLIAAALVACGSSTTSSNDAGTSADAAKDVTISSDGGADGAPPSDAASDAPLPDDCSTLAGAACSKCCKVKFADGLSTWKKQQTCICAGCASQCATQTCAVDPLGPTGACDSCAAGSDCTPEKESCTTDPDCKALDQCFIGCK